MPSKFAADFQSQAQPALADRYGEFVMVQAFAAGELSHGAKVGEPYVAFAIVDMLEEALSASGAAVADRTGVVLTQPQAEFAYTEFGADKPRVLAGFEITLIDRSVQTRWRVKGDPRDDGVSCIVAILERIA